MTTNKIYCCVSSSDIPPEVTFYVRKLSARLKELGFHYRSTGLTPLDISMNLIQGSGSSTFYGEHLDYHNWHVPTMKRYLPNFNRIISSITLEYYQRNLHQLSQNGTHTYSDFLICWTPCGSETEEDIHRNNEWKHGLVSSSIAIANVRKIPVFNLQNPDALSRFYAFMKKNYTL